MGFGTITLPHLHKVSVSLKTSSTLLPLRLLRNQTLSRKPSNHDSLFVKAATTENLESSRPLTHFPPSFWGDHFLSVPLDDYEFDAIEREIHSVMMPKVRDMLMSSHRSDKERIRLIHLLISLGISHYFEIDIEEILNQAFLKLESLISEEDDLETMAIMFEVFRLYGHKMSCDAFDRFKGEDRKFKKSLANDVRGILQLYEAAHLGTPSEDIMDEALVFTRARYHSIEILVARQYISFYDQEEDHHEMLLKFAKLNFNFCQMHYIKELKIVTKWWEELGMTSKLPYIRDRSVEIYLGGMGMFFEPRYSLGRILGAKLTVVITVLDDTCDAYATLPEVVKLAAAIQRWDLAAIEELPIYMRIIYRNVFETVKEMDREMRGRGKISSVQRTVDEIKSLMRLYLTTAEWARTSHVPSFEEYMEVGIPSAALDDAAACAFIAMDDCDEKRLSEWFNSKPKILHALNTVFRLRNDIVTFEQEMSRGEVANGVNCYMKQYGVTKEAAMEELRKMERENYKIMMEEFMISRAVPRQILVRVVNIGRAIDLYYKEGDGIGHPDQKLKDILASLFLHPIPL
ncbi:unnamed protein product [Arabidopsis arenosa]|uniref:Uncharacterized protein n=1 Tax=Arabidopsis arenosa TaxID=38785 RepID=A0A8S1ZUU0_ARAAE|nr:unnamed protein product [Arabidopsis arenosa]